MRINFLRKIVNSTLKSSIRWLPETRAFYSKRRILNLAGLDISPRVRICSSAKFMTLSQIIIGEGTWIGHEFLAVGGKAKIDIGKECDIAPRVTFATGTHELDLEGTRIAGAGSSNEIKIGDGTWICTNVTILGGSSIGRKCVIAAGSTVRGHFPNNVLIGGVPAKIIRQLV